MRAGGSRRLKFVGIDLAWGENSPSGLAVIDHSGTVRRACANLATNDEICEFAEIEQGGGTVVTIDAPLIVRNPDRCRPVEQRLTGLFWSYDAGPYPANLSNAAFQPNGRITALVRQLGTLGFVQRTCALHDPEERTVIEVFPSPAQVILFPAQNRRQHIHCRGLRYKPKRDRLWAEVHSQWETYRARIRSLEYSIPAIKFAPEVQKQIGIDITEYKGAQYKQFDDLLDGIFCAYLAYYFWHAGEQGCWVLGDLESGCITLPKCPLAASAACTLEHEIL